MEIEEHGKDVEVVTAGVAEHQERPVLDQPAEELDLPQDRPRPTWWTASAIEASASMDPWILKRIGLALELSGIAVPTIFWYEAPMASPAYSMSVSKFVVRTLQPLRRASARNACHAFGCPCSVLTSGRPRQDRGVRAERR